MHSVSSASKASNEESLRPRKNSSLTWPKKPSVQALSRQVALRDMLWGDAQLLEPPPVAELPVLPPLVRMQEGRPQVIVCGAPEVEPLKHQTQGPLAPQQLRRLRSASSAKALVRFKISSPAPTPGSWPRAPPRGSRRRGSRASACAPWALRRARRPLLHGRRESSARARTWT